MANADNRVSPRPGTKYVILFTPRTGSTHFQYCLKSPCVIAENERLLPFARDASLSTQEQGLKQIEYLLASMGAARPARVRAYGLRVNLEYVRYPELFADLLRAVEAKVLVVQRRNLIKNALSRYNQRRLIEMTGKAELRQDQAAFRMPPAQVDLREFEEDLAAVIGANSARDAFTEGLQLPVKTIDYEALVADERATVAAAFEFLGVPVAETTTKLAKVTNDDLRDAIANYDAFRLHFQGTPYQQMLD